MGLAVASSTASQTKGRRGDKERLNDKKDGAWAGFSPQTIRMPRVGKIWPFS